MTEWQKKPWERYWARKGERGLLSDVLKTESRLLACQFANRLKTWQLPSEPINEEVLVSAAAASLIDFN